MSRRHGLRGRPMLPRPVLCSSHGVLVVRVVPVGPYSWLLCCRTIRYSVAACADQVLGGKHVVGVLHVAP